MRLTKTRATILLCSVALIGLSEPASAQSARHHHDRRHAVAATASARSSPSYGDERYAFLRNAWARRHARTSSVRRHHTAPRRAIASISGGNALVAEARKYLGTNPTGRKSLWCGAFVDLILRKTGHKGGGNLALGYEHYGHRVGGPQVGAIAVMGRKGGGHVGIVVGVDANGNPILVSGNHNHTVAESVYPRRRILAYVEPNN